MTFRKLEDADVKGLRVLVRVDFNVPVSGGVITDGTRLRAAMPTIEDLQARGAKTILLSHFGRPKGERVASMSLAPVAPVLGALLGSDVTFVEDCIGAAAEQAVAAMKPGDVLLLENTRFHAGEQKNDPALACQIADLGDAFVSDAFSVTHRAHASTVGVAQHLPSYAGKAMARELTHLQKALGTPRHPVLAVVGGAKVSTKIDLLQNLVTKVDMLCVGGGMANTFLHALGKPVGASLCEAGLADTARTIMTTATQNDCALLLPLDVVVAQKFEANAPHQTLGFDGVGETDMILDAGPQSIDALKAAMDTANTVIWNGPLGAFELTPFDAATNAAARYCAELTRAGKLISVAGGGDTVAALNKAGAAGDFSFISTAGGAFLEWMEGKALPGVEVLKNK